MQNLLWVHIFENNLTLFFLFQAQAGKGGGGGGEEMQSEPTYQMCIKLPWSLSHVEFCTLMMAGKHAKKARNVVATLLILAKVICTCD